MTNARCSYWHFRTDANSDMKVAALTSYLAGQKQVKQVFLLNPNYAYGQEVSRAARSMLAAKRPDLKIVGDDFHPLGQVKDYSPISPRSSNPGPMPSSLRTSVPIGTDRAGRTRSWLEHGLLHPQRQQLRRAQRHGVRQVRAGSS
jgi:hypothetical protein